jgi:UDP-glucose 4-epimerase
MNVLIIGSQGFIGQNLTQHLNKNPNFQLSKADILPLQEPNYTQLNSQNADFSPIFKQKSYDICINCAGAANVSLSFTHPQTDFDLNVKNVASILENIRIFNPNCKFINLSSAAVYGNPNAIPVTELADFQPLSPYAFHKKMSELLCQEYAQCYGLKTCALRIFSAYGEGLQKQLFWDIYQKTIANPTEILLFGTGEESRDFIYIEDLCAAIVLIINKLDFNGQVVNVANGQEILIKNAVSVFLKLLDYQGVIDFNGQNRIGDPLRWQADIQQLLNLNYQAAFSLEMGLSNYVKWIKKLN